MFTERRTYSELLHAEEGMATNVLAARLRWLETAGLIRKRGSGRGAEYGLTEKGLDLLPAMLQLIAWSAKHDRRTAAPKAFVNRIRRDPSGLASELRARLSEEYGLS
jgi:DNA-binding HxlR family transcriptional regulator